MDTKACQNLAKQAATEKGVKIAGYAIIGLAVGVGVSILSSGKVPMLAGCSIGAIAGAGYALKTIE